MTQRSTTRSYQEPRFARIGHGWDRDTIEQYIKNPIAYDEFDDKQEFEAHLDDLEVTEEDYQEWQGQQDIVNWYNCGHCENEIAELEEQSDYEAAEAIEPEYTVRVSETERPVDFGGEAAKRVEKTLEAYCDRHRDDGALFEYTQSWLEDEK